MKRTGLLLLGAGSPLILVASLVGGEWGSWTLAVCSLLFPVALIGLAAGNRRSPSPGPAVLSALAALLLVSGVAILLADRAVQAGRTLGLPVASWIMLLGLGLGPLLLTCWAFASGFDRFGPDAAQLKRLARFKSTHDDDAAR